MALPAYSSFSQWYCEGRQASFVWAKKSPGGVRDLLEVARPAEDMSRPALPDIAPYQDMRGGSRVSGNLGGASCAPAKGGLAKWAMRRCLELVRARLSDDVSLDELAAEAQLSTFYFARMFKQSLGVPPRVYMTRLRLEKACELLEQTDLPVTEIALKVGYSSNQVRARVFLKHRWMSPTGYRWAVRDPVRASIAHRPRPAPEGWP